MSNLKNTLWGILLIVVGLIIGLNALGITNIDIFFDGWWTLFIIIPCVIGIFTEKEKSGNIIGLIIGLLFLLSSQEIIDFELVFKLIFPTILVIIGISLIFKNTNKKEITKEVKNDLEYTSTFSYQTINFDKKDFNGCNIDAIFGGTKCDLTEIKIKDESVINATSIFGGINIIVPNDINVIVKSTSIFGGVSNKCVNNEENKKILYVNATCLFGGIEINDKSTKID